MKKLITILVALVVSANSFGQVPNWAWASKGIGANYEGGSNTATDNLGNVFVTGTFDSTITFGAYTLIDTTGLSMFIVKYDALGNVLWANNVMGLTNMFGGYQGCDITTDAQGNVYMIGNFDEPSISFGAIALTNSNGLNYGTNFFIVKYDGSGNALWAEGGEGVAYSTTADALGNVFVAGIFARSINIGAYTLANLDTSTTSYYADIFTVKYGTSGNIIWVKSAGGLKDDNGPYIDVDTFGNVYVTGSFNSSSMTIGAFTINNSNNSGNNGYDIFIAKYDAMGNVLWAKDAGGIGSADYANSIATDPSGNAYITGTYYTPSITFGTITLYNTDTSSTSTNIESFIVKYNQQGDVVWANGIGSNSWDYGYGICTDVSGNIYVTGTYSTPITFGSTTLQNAIPGLFNAFVAKYNASGNVIWAKAVDGGASDYSYGIDADVAGNVFITGVTNTAPLILGTDTLVYGTNWDMFLAKLGNTPVSSVETNMGDEINLFPNPTSSTFSFTILTLKNTNISITTLTGTEVGNYNTQNTSTQTIDISHLANGVYFVSLKSEEGVLTKKIIKQ
jgi:hypothetical protein